MEKPYWENRYRRGEFSTRICPDWNWDKEACEGDDNCIRKGPAGECTMTIGFQRAWKWKTIGDMIRKYSPELAQLKSHLHSPPEPEAKVLHGRGSKRTVRDSEMEDARPEGGNCWVLPKVIDVGCGDVTFWNAESLRLAHPRTWYTHEIMRTEEYIGIDLSDSAITRNRRDPEKGWSFIVSPAHILQEGLKAPVVFCIDLLFHIMDDTAFPKILKNLCYYSEDLILIHTWKNNPFEASDEVSDGVYQTYRPLAAYFGFFRHQGFTLMEERLNPNSTGALYVFKQSV